MVSPLFLAVSPAERDPKARAATAAMLASLARTVPGLDVLGAWLDDSPSGLVAQMSRMDRHVVLVPTRPALPARLAEQLHDVAEHAHARVDVASSLGPDRRLARAAVARLRASGARWGDAVVLAAPPGSCDGIAVFETLGAAAQLASEWGPDVTAACVSEGCELDGVTDAVAELRAFGHPRVFVVPYVVTYAGFLPALTAGARGAGATAVTGPLGPHRLVTDLLVSRYEQAVRPRVRGAVSAA